LEEEAVDIRVDLEVDPCPLDLLEEVAQVAQEAVQCPLDLREEVAQEAVQ